MSPRRHTLSIVLIAATSLLAATPLLTMAMSNGSAAGTSVYASPGGGGNGSSASSPLSLQAALGSSSPAGPGSTVWLAAGTYRGCFTSVLSGTTTAPVVVRPMPGARAVLDGATCPADATLTINGTDSWFRDLEVMNSDPDRRTETPGSDPADYQRATGINVYGPRTKIINGWVHDNGNGIGLWSQAVNSEIYGTVITRNGWSAPDRGHGHGIYTQNSTGRMLIGDVMSLSNYATGMKAFGYAGQAVGYRFNGVISADNGVPGMLGASDSSRQPNLLVGTDQSPADDIAVTDSAFYQAPGTVGGGVTLGWSYPTNGTMTVTGNTIGTGAQGLAVNNWKNITVSRNTIFANATANPNANATLATARTLAGGAVAWNDNTYYDSTRTVDRVPFTYNDTKNTRGGGLLSFTEWQANTGGYDSASRYFTTQPPNTTIVRPNRYEPGRANIAIFNWSRQSTAMVDLSRTGLSTGQGYRLLDPYDLNRVVASGTYGGQPVAVPTPTQLTTYLLVPTGSATTTSTTTAPTTSTTTAPTTSTTTAPTTSTTTAPTTSTTTPTTVLPTVHKLWPATKWGVSRRG